ncbi:magnesium transporter [Corynebacterium sp. YIM 101645]|uniref:Magnesium transporter n=1 Tax=Corynebacterium lemuris TaxID=1859292 RepID=A0ABT2FUS4_9CORY|nr:general stress protein [Corynebacterium lemuris]MCS5478901.1 magnesium transporter [Corynebacterium lemuris]
MSAPLRPRPTGWPIGSFGSYEDAQAAVDKLSDMQFPVQDLTIVGVDLMEVERVTGRLTWGRVIGGGALSGAWIGLFFGLLFGLLGGGFLTPLLLGIAIGVVFGIVSAAVPYAMSAGRRDFTSRTQIVAGRYDVLADPARATEARDIIARSGLTRQAGSGG